MSGPKKSEPQVSDGASQLDAFKKVKHIKPDIIGHANCLAKK
jgi:hypothetical protein